MSIKVGAMLLVLLATGPAFAQKDKMGTGESLTGSVIKAKPAPGAPAQAPAVKQESVSVESAEIVQDLKVNVAKAPTHVRDSINFLLHWCGRAKHPEVVGPEVKVDGVPLDATKLLCPVKGLSTIREKGAVVGMRVKEGTVAAAGTKRTTSWRLELKPRTDGWVVTSVKTF